jgi:hypothetical protein
MWLCSVKSTTTTTTIIIIITGQNSISLKMEAACYSETSMSTH